jgi:hypothetical protein
MFEHVAMVAIPWATRVNRTSPIITSIATMVIITQGRVLIMIIHLHVLFHRPPGLSVPGPGVHSLTTAVGVEYFRGVEEKMGNFVLVHDDLLKLCQQMINSQPAP